jgi:c-di-GMP-binding flagellar brake protein YcgR
MTSSDPREVTLSPGLVSTSADEVVRVLHALQARREPLAALTEGSTQLSEWKLRFVDTAKQYIVIGPLSGTGSIETLITLPQVAFRAEFGGMHIEFTGSDPQLIEHEGAAAVRLGFPAATVSRQKRVYPRAPVPADMPLYCAVPAGAGVALEAQIMDISEGGLGLLVRGAYLSPAPGTLIKGWQIERPGRSSVSVDLEVRHCRPLVLGDGAGAQRWGCQFINPSGEVTELIRMFASG